MRGTIRKGNAMGQGLTPERMLDECTFMALRLHFDNFHDTEDAAADGVLAMLEAEKRAKDGKPLDRYERRCAFGAIHNYYNYSKNRRDHESVTLNAPMFDEQNNAVDRGEFIDIIHEEPGESYQERLAATEEDLYIRKIFESLPEPDKTVIRRRFLQHMTLKEVGESMYLTNERIRQIEERALELLRRRYLHGQ